MREMINSLGSLPSLPSIYQQLIEALRSESTTVHEIGQLIEQDMAMSAKVLQMVNSAFFGLPQQIASPVHAVSLLGIETVTNLALTAGVFAQLKPSLVAAFDLQALWSHSLSVAGLARKFCSELQGHSKQCDVPVLAGLLHDLGKLVLISANQEEYRRIVTLAEAQGLPLHVAEAESLWTDHAAVGAYLMGLWGLPYEAVEAVAVHHKPALITREQKPSLAVYAANLLIHNLKESRHSDDYMPGDLERLVGIDEAARWIIITREFLDGETA
jgi:putative nucleotidyltransferase with HDIG domain